MLSAGTGRCGSTTLAGTVAMLPDVCAMHENPPLIYWEPVEEQVRFHLDRLRFLADYYAVVFDASHWWLNVLRRFFAEFPEGKAIGLHAIPRRAFNHFCGSKAPPPARSTTGPRGTTISGKQTPGIRRIRASR